MMGVDGRTRIYDKEGNAKTEIKNKGREERVGV